MKPLRRVALHAASLVVLHVVVACGGAEGPAAAPAASPGAGPTAKAAYPVVRIVRDDNFADERSSSTFDVRADGSFDIEHVMSNGGAEATVTACTGRVAENEASDWHARVRDEATLTTPPRGPSREEAFERRIPYRYTVAYARAAETAGYADPARWPDDLVTFLEHLSAAARCRTFTRAD